MAPETAQSPLFGLRHGDLAKCCMNWAWAPSHLQAGFVVDAAGLKHHPACRCAAGVVGCRDDVVDRSAHEGVGITCLRHGGSR